ncbi:uncharacterized protein LOC132101366 [Carassius carassius]|uniref:uncharacterized protein LOC132101366 n=1 Tax=Carassius carassius TaxID=217509 RepID=UPI0028686DC1|nr:uncharacterized protein LOC132101366 [Carassius carassius]
MPKERPIKTVSPALHPIKVKEPWEVVGMDLIGPLKKTMKDHQYILTVTDLFTKWVIAEPLKCGSSTEVAEALVSKLYTFGMVRKIITDRGRAFVNELNAHIFAALNIKHAITSAYHPQSNGQDERTNQNVKRTLRKYVNQHHDDWDIHLQAIVYGINTAKQRSTKYSPYFLMYNRHPRLPQALNICETDAAFELADPEEELELKLALVKALNETVRENIENAQGKQKKAFEAKKRKGVRQCSLKAGDEVLIGEPKKKVKKGNCLQDLHQGPFTLTSLTEKGVASVAMLGKIQKVNVAQLRPYFRPQDHGHESEGSQNNAEDIGLVDHQYANKGPLWSKRLCPQQEQVLTYVLDRTHPAKEIVVLDGPVCLQREDFWSLGLEEQIGNACFRLVEEAARRHGMDVHIADLFEVPKWKLREPSLPDNVESKDIIILPAWSRGSQTASHYMLCVLLVAKKEAIFLDSLCPNGFGDEKYRIIFRQLAGEVANGPWVEKTGKDYDPFPVQSDGQSCGIFMIMYALCICTGAMFNFLDTDIPSIRKWWCIQILEKFSIARHGQNFGQRFAFWTEEAEQLMAGTLPPIYRIYRPQIVKEEQVEVEELPLTLKHMYEAEYIVRNSVGLFTGQMQEPTYMFMDHDDRREAWRVLESMQCDAMEPFTFIFEKIKDMETFMIICKDTLNLRVNAGVGLHSDPHSV